MFPGTVTDLRFKLESGAAVKQPGVLLWEDSLFRRGLDEALGFGFTLGALGSVEPVLRPGVVLTDIWVSSVTADMSGRVTELDLRF